MNQWLAYNVPSSAPLQKAAYVGKENKQEALFLLSGAAEPVTLLPRLPLLTPHSLPLLN